jgi:hypothetical protein
MFIGTVDSSRHGPQSDTQKALALSVADIVCFQIKKAGFSVSCLGKLELVSPAIMQRMGFLQLTYPAERTSARPTDVCALPVQYRSSWKRAQLGMRCSHELETAGRSSYRRLVAHTKPRALTRISPLTFQSSQN